jgi:hypothetical protein
VFGSCPPGALAAQSDEPGRMPGCSTLSGSVADARPGLHRRSFGRRRSLHDVRRAVPRAGCCRRIRTAAVRGRERASSRPTVARWPRLSRRSLWRGGAGPTTALPLALTVAFGQRAAAPLAAITRARRARTAVMTSSGRSRAGRSRSREFTCSGSRLELDGRRCALGDAAPGGSGGSTGSRLPRGVQRRGIVCGRRGTQVW